jgi:Tfp pilus assembly protein PilN
MLIIIILGWSVSTKLAGSRMELEEKTKELVALNPLSIATKALSAKKRKLQAELNSYPLSLLRQSMNPARILEDLRLCAPDNTRLEQINVIEREGKKYVQVTGTAFSLDERGPAMSDFMASLKESQLFDDVRMISVHEEGSYTIDGLKFRLSCQYNYNNL